MQYTTVAKVRESAGFVGNTNVTDASISNLIRRAQGMIDSKLRRVYQLPFPKYHFNTIVFSGTGSGAGTMTFTIGGETIAVTIASGLTAAQAADRFRTAALDNGTFVTDGLGDGATVTIHGIAGDDSTDVAITSTDPQTVAGITATGGTVTETTVPTIEVLATEIAAALLLIREYGPEAQDTDKDGFKRLAMWKKDLQSIADKKEAVLDFEGQELPLAATSRIRFYPTEDSATDEDDPTASFLPKTRQY